MEIIKGLVSIITPSYNSAIYLDSTIKSVLNQDYAQWEMIIVDDCSSDASFEIAQRFSQNDSRIFSFRMPSKSTSGPAAPRNFGLALAKGQYITFLDSDDLWEPCFLSHQLQFMSNMKSPFVFSSYFRQTQLDNDVFIVPPKTNFRKMLKSNPCSCLTSIYDRSQIGLFFMPETAIRREDFACFLKIVKKVGTAYGNPEVLATYRIHSASASSNKMKLIRFQWNVYRNEEHINFFRSLFLLFCWAFLGLYKYRGLKRR